MREPGGDRSWWPSMGRFREDGAQAISLVLTGWAYKNIFVLGGRILGGISSLTRAMARKSLFGMISGVGIELLKRHFQVYSPLPVLRRLPFQIVWSNLMVRPNGIFSFLG
jgi:branched-subunit amino acid ABC-type transport system permease component